MSIARSLDTTKKKNKQNMYVDMFLTVIFG